MSLGESTDETRKRILAWRRGLPQDEVLRLSEQVIRNFLGFLPADRKHFWSGMKVGLYRAVRSELNLDLLQKELIAAGASLYFPRVIDPSSAYIEMAHVPNPTRSSSWQAGHYGIEEPRTEFPSEDPAILDVIFVPGVAYGKMGERIGTGVGYFDRFLSRANKALRIGLAFDGQLLPEIEQKPWDQKVHWVVTEAREVRTSRVDGFLKDRS